MKRLALALVLLLAAIWFTSASADGGIRVVAQSHENRFPKELVFRLHAEGDQEIRKVTLYYRVGNSKSISYAYPRSTPGTRAEAEYSLRNDGRGMVPGSELSYYYVIEDAAGASLKTEPVQIVYEDTRFAWRKLEGRGVSVYHYGQEQTGRKVLEAAEGTLEKMKSRAGVSLERPVKVLVYGSKGDMDIALPFRSETTTWEVQWVGMAFAGADVVIVLGSSTGVKDVTAHELTHLLTDQLTSNPFTRIPAWLDEGLSMYAQDEPFPGFQAALDTAVRSGKLGTVRSLSSVPGKPEDINKFYGQAESLVRYLVSSYGPDKMSQLLAAFKKGAATDEALKEVYGFDVDGLDAQWRAAIGAPPLQGSAGQAGPAQPEKVPTIVPFGAKQPESAPTGAAAEDQSRVVLYLGLAASVAVLSLAFLSGLFLVRRR